LIVASGTICGEPEPATASVPSCWPSNTPQTTFPSVVIAAAPWALGWRTSSSVSSTAAKMRTDATSAAPSGKKRSPENAATAMQPIASSPAMAPVATRYPCVRAARISTDAKRAPATMSRTNRSCGDLLEVAPPPSPPGAVINTEAT